MSLLCFLLLFGQHLWEEITRQEGRGQGKQQKEGCRRAGGDLVGERHANPSIILIISFMIMISPDSTEGSARQSESRSGSPQGYEAKAPLEEGLKPVQS